MVSGLTVSGDIDNIESIGASLENYYIYDGIRECQMSDFGSGGYANVNENKRSERLAEEIKMSRQISPLIVVVDDEGPYVLEGGHRADALQLLGVQSFPSLLVLDQGTDNELV